jgi:CTP synthase (UTP-ammonia lyase)
MSPQDNKQTLIGIIGDYKEGKHTHRALQECIRHCQPHVGNVSFEWLPTSQLHKVILNSYDGYWIAPGSPYADDEAVYTTIRRLRERDHIVLGTCAGFQYMLIEYVRNVLNIPEATHEESEPHADVHVIEKLACSLKASREDVIVEDENSWLYRVMGAKQFEAGYNCTYGLSTAWQQKLSQAPLAFTGFSPDGMARAFELRNRTFFRGTLFQPPLTSSPEKPSPLILDFIRACEGAS